MKLAVMADIHGNKLAFEAVLADLASVGEVDKIWILGDLAAFGTQPAYCIAKCRELVETYGKDKCHVIGGNTDRYLVTGKRPEGQSAKDEEGFLKRVSALKERDAVLNWNLSQLTWADYEFLTGIIGREVQWRVKGYGDVIGYHAIPGDDEPVALKPDSPDEEALDALLDRAGKCAIGGHTHQRMDRTLGTWRVINPGSVGMSFREVGQAEWALLTFDNETLQVDLRAVPYEVAQVVADAQTGGHPHPDMLAKQLMFKI